MAGSLVRLRLVTHNARLVDARKERGMNGDDMAVAAGLSRGRLRRIETLKVLPTSGEMARIAIVLQKPIDELFPEELLFAIERGVFSKRQVEMGAPQILRLAQVRQQDLVTDGGLDVIEEEADARLVREAVRTLPPANANCTYVAVWTRQRETRNTGRRRQQNGVYQEACATD